MPHGHRYPQGNRKDKIQGENTKIVLSKSNVLYEIKLREILEKDGKDIWETDLGEYLVQINHDMP